MYTVCTILRCIIACLQDYILSQDPIGEMPPIKWEDHIFEMSRVIEPKDAPPKKAVSLMNY